MPVLLLTINQAAPNQTVSGVRVPWKIVPAVSARVVDPAAARTPPTYGTEMEPLSRQSADMGTAIIYASYAKEGLMVRSGDENLVIELSLSNLQALATAATAWLAYTGGQEETLVEAAAALDELGRERLLDAIHRITQALDRLNKGTWDYG